jgi:hypothetical protein
LEIGHSFKWNKRELVLISTGSIVVKKECYLQTVFFSQHNGIPLFSGIQLNLGKKYLQATIRNFAQKSKKEIIFWVEVEKRNGKKLGQRS